MARWLTLLICCFFIALSITHADDAPATAPSTAAPSTSEPSTTPSGGILKEVHIDLKKKQIRVDCTALNVEMPLEFFCVTNNGPDHESVLRTTAKPSEIHFGLLAMGLKPGVPAHFDQATSTWYPPSGPPLNISCEFTVNGVTKTVPAYRMMRSTKSKKEMPPMTWVFDGSRVMPDGTYAGDVTGYVVSIVNFDLTMIDIPQLASNANETLEWDCNTDIVPKRGTPVTMIIEPAADAATTRPAGKPAKDFNPGPGLHQPSDNPPGAPAPGAGDMNK